jgi:hypothetical protein
VPDHLLPRLVTSVSHDPQRTAENWTRLGEDAVLDAMDGEFFRSITENHVDALAFDALRLLGWDVQISPYLVAFLKRRAALNEAVYEAHYEALLELHKAAGDLVAQAMIPKGALLGPLYPSLQHRRMTDFDLVVAPSGYRQLIEVLQRLGYREEPGGFGCDLVKRIGPMWSWRDRVTMHVFERKQSYDRYLVGSAIRDVPCLIPVPELHVIALLMNAQEHAASFSFASFGSDLQYIRVIDVELLVERYDIAALPVWRVAGDLGVRAEVALGLWVQQRLRGSLPRGWDVLAPAVRAVDPFGELVALPTGDIRRWEIPVPERVFHPRRTRLALAMLPPGYRRPEYLQDLRRSLFQEDEPARRIVTEAGNALREVAADIPE